MKKLLFTFFIGCANLLSAQLCFNSVGIGIPVGNTPTAIITADFNKDGKADLAVSNEGSDNVSILLGSGTGFFGTANNFPVPINSQPLFLCTADFNEDGNLDIATANANANNVSILLGSGTGTFGPAINSAALGTPFGICTADFNGDGHMDLAAADGGGNTISVLLGSGTGNFAPYVTFVVGTNPYSVCTGDFNKDGKIDLAVSNDVTKNVIVLINTITSTTATPTFTTSTNITTGAGTPNPRSIISTDYNMDGNLDLAVANEGTDNVSIFFGNGGGTFFTGPTANMSPSSQPRCVISADFNMDGQPDLATADYGNVGPYASVVINGSGLGQNINLPGGVQNPHGICSGDFNGDGAPDLAVVNETSNNLNILLNNYPVVNFSGDTAICSGKTATMIASGTNTYTWSPSVTIVSTSATSETVTATPTANTTYTVTANNSGCSVTGTFTVTVTVNAVPNVSISSTSNTVCAGGSATLTPGPASTYTWSTNANTGNIVVTPTTTTNYSVSGTNIFGCVNSANFVLNVFASPTVTVNSAAICAGGTAILTASGVSSYTWSTGATGANLAPSPTGNASYTVTGTDGNGCTNTAVSTVTVNPLPNVQINGMNNGTSSICSGNSAILNGSGGSSAITYTWSTSAWGVTHITVTPANGESFGLTAADANGCKNSTTITFSLYALPNITVNSAVVCHGTHVTLKANGANTYTWSTSATTNTISVAPTVNTNYTVTGTDANTCTNTAVASVSAPANLAPDICMATTDSASSYNYNIVYWDKIAYANADSFIVYRYDVLGNNYLRIGSVSKDSLSAFMDTARHIGTGGSVHNGDPNYGSWKYKLAVKDTCGNVSAQSPYHQTVFLQNQNNGNFNVSQYVIEAGQTDPVTGYFLYRDDLGTNNYQALVPISGTSASDPNYTSFPNANYRVDILGFNCTPTLRLANGNNNTLAAKVRSHSNSNNNKNSGINKITNVSEVKVYPNPANNNIIIQANVELGSVVIYNALGEVVMQVSTKNTREQIDLGKLAPGVYTIEAKNSFTKLIKE